jgi:hypothetical protein
LVKILEGREDAPLTKDDVYTFLRGGSSALANMTLEDARMAIKNNPKEVQALDADLLAKKERKLRIELEEH